LADLKSQNIAGENDRENLQDDKRWLGYKIGEAKDHQYRAEKELKETDLTSLNQKIAELTTERDALQKKLTIAQQQLDDKRSDRS
jgi:hypothetical protein